MSGFASEWLALREPADARARSGALLPEIEADVIRILDLGAGTGSNLRYLAPRLSRAQHWTLVDDDASLLASVDVPQIVAPLEVERLKRDLAVELGSLPLAQIDLVTSSALFDLVSREWIARLAARCRDARVPAALFALNFDGVIAWTPEEPADPWIADLFREHMRGDKGFGPATGPGSVAALCEVFASAGYRIRTAQTPWRIGGEEQALQATLLEGYAEVAREMAPHRAGEIADWAARRRALIARGASRLVVGHQDVLATHG
jgi:hypothetical protein